MDTWIFAYGSLLWDPGFAPAETVPATVPDWRRSFCLWSLHWRGTADRPGLVLGLEQVPGAACDGLVLRPDRAEAADVVEALRARELVSKAYEERHVAARLADGREVEALTYVIRDGHPQHARLSIPEQADVIAAAHGLRGPNRDYLAATAARFAELGIRDEGVEEVARRLGCAAAPVDRPDPALPLSTPRA